MQAGRNRHRVIIQNKVTTRSSSGQPKEQWVDGREVWAEVNGVSGRELVASAAEKAEITIRVWMRYRQDVTATSRLRVKTGPFKGNTLEVVGPPIPDAKATRLEILCKQGVVS